MIGTQPAQSGRAMPARVGHHRHMCAASPKLPAPRVLRNHASINTFIVSNPFPAHLIHSTCFGETPL